MALSQNGHINVCGMHNLHPKLTFHNENSNLKQQSTANWEKVYLDHTDS